MPDTDPGALIKAYLLDLYGGDPFADVYDACETHREQHGEECGVYPAEPVKMRTLATIVKAMNARNVLEIGGGIGYSALWLAEAIGRTGRLETIDRFLEHTRLIDGYAKKYDLAGRINAIHGEAEEVTKRLSGPYDVIHDDGWFGEKPAYFDRMVELLKPGGLLILANFFLLEDAISGKPRQDWSRWAGPDWATNVRAYAEMLAADKRLHFSFVFRPAWVGLAYKRTDA